MNNHAITKIVAWPLLVLVLHIIVTLVGLYELFWWFDIPLHFLGGFAVAISSAALLRYFEASGKYKVSWTPLNILVLLGFTAIAVVAWELFEFLFDLYFHTNQQPGLLDTMKDMCVGLTGGGLAIIISTFFRRK